MPDNNYWKSRFKQLEAAQNRKGADTYLEIERQYRQAQKELEGKINTWYQRFATNNGVSMAEARRMLKDRELAELKWDVKEYIRRGQENAFTGQWMKELENASARFHISRLEALKLQTQQSLELMFGNQLDSIDTAMKRIYLEGYYHTAYELQKGFRIGWDIAGLDQRQIEKVICKPWAVDGKNFSERVWGNKEKLITEVHSELTQDILLGRDPQKAIDNIARKMNASKNNAGRLVMTEEAYFSSAAQKDCFKDLGVEQYEIVATLDSHTSDICQEMDGKVFPMKDFEPGVTAPPFHVYCRSTTVPYFDDDFGQKGERAARNAETGKTYLVPDNMNYKEWKETFVDGGDKSDFNVFNREGIIHWTRKEKSDKMKTDIKLGELEGAYGKKHKNTIVKLLSDAPEVVQKVWNDCVDNFHCLEPKYRGTQAFYSPSRNGVKLSISSAAKGSDYQTPYQVVFHEYGHHADYVLNRRYGDGNPMKAFSEVYQEGILGKTLKEEAAQHIKDFAAKNNIVDIVEAERQFCYQIKSELTLLQRADISDMFEPVMSEKCSYPFGIGHGFNYWKKRDNGKEGFAEMYSATVNNPDSLVQIKRFFPRSYKIFLEMLEVVQ
ncbi:MAG: minor capsid protein [Lachnospiraceae bacterium]|nr:minor capsid protein [Lachnospiraceae bacterium]